MRTGRLWSLVLYALCGSGVAIALALTVTEARESEPVEVREVVHRRDGGVVTVEADLRNHSDVPRRPDVRAAARDRESRDLAELIATPLSGEPAIPPGATVRFSARIDDLTCRELDEELSDVVIYVYEPHRCPAELEPASGT